VKILPPELCAICSGRPLDAHVFLTKFSANVCRIPSTCTLLAGISVRVPADEHDVPIPFVTLRLGLEAVLVLQLLDQLVVTLDIFLRRRVGVDGWCRAILLGWTASVSHILLYQSHVFVLERQSSDFTVGPGFSGY